MLTNRLSLADARILIEGARGRAEEIGVPMCIAVTDESGQLIAFERMDGGKITSTIIAQDKAYTAAGAKRTTESYGEVSQPGKPAYGINSAIGGRLLVVAGGIPVIVDGQVVGAVGVSSGTPGQDKDCAQAGIDLFSRPQRLKSCRWLDASTKKLAVPVPGIGSLAQGPFET
ncbi:GlcG/HbpS family heme-binding protein [Rhizobium lentis]|uniref:Heme-binding protein n=1 Tax=Rhizobium lentis TaxID=1138194 RepID=A0ABS7I8H1_9HYPH|nr:heme-binding protein [Rhizobium lentis]MBX4958221.1 heme-binding protein [Rhizobium lentis]MBX4976391.1 heme-binding protein [Rhizobium lentis]MBX4988225.1 heme-binding protein [Rhizobium lentis]MBX4998897.1 heme-binding protein [Rhizobium lentis]MBX5006674.1 heme-binding protein [Rhizobium lentis]